MKEKMKNSFVCLTLVCIATVMPEWSPQWEEEVPDCLISTEKRLAIHLHESEKEKKISPFILFFESGLEASGQKS